VPKVDVEGKWEGGSKGKNNSPSPPIWRSPFFASDTWSTPLLLSSSGFHTAGKGVENFHFKSLGWRGHASLKFNLI